MFNHVSRLLNPNTDSSIQYGTSAERCEEERMRLEERFSILVQGSRSRHEACINKLRARYIEFLEEQRGREERNLKLLGALDKVDSNLALMTAKTDRLSVLRKQYEAYLLRVYANRGTGDSGIGSQNEGIPLRKDTRTNPPLQARSSIPPQNNNLTLNVPQINYPQSHFGSASQSNLPGRTFDSCSSPQSQFYLHAEPNSQSQNASIRQPHSEQFSPFTQDLLQPRNTPTHFTRVHFTPTTYVPQESLQFDQNVSQFTRTPVPHEFSRPVQTFPQYAPSHASHDRVPPVQSTAHFAPSHASLEPSQLNRTFPQFAPSYISQKGSRQNQTFPEFPQAQLPRQLPSQTLDDANAYLQNAAAYYGDAQLPTQERMQVPRNPMTEFRGVLPDNSSFGSHRQSTPLPGYLDYSTRYSREPQRRDLDDVTQALGFTKSDLEDLVKRNERILPRDYLHNPETLKPVAEPPKLTANIERRSGLSRNTKTMEDELDQYISKIKNLHRDMDLQSLEDADVEQNTSGDILNVTLSDDGAEQLPVEGKTKDAGKVGTPCSEDVKEVLALADDLLSKTAIVPKGEGGVGNIECAPRNDLGSVHEVMNMNSADVPVSKTLISSSDDKHEDEDELSRFAAGENRSAIPPLDAELAASHQNNDPAADLMASQHDDPHRSADLQNCEIPAPSRTHVVGDQVPEDAHSVGRARSEEKYGETEKAQELEGIERNKVNLVDREQGEIEEHVVEVVKEFQPPNLRHYEKKVQEVFLDDGDKNVTTEKTVQREAGKSEMTEPMLRENAGLTEEKNASGTEVAEPLNQSSEQQERFLDQEGGGLRVDEVQDEEEPHAAAKLIDDHPEGGRTDKDEREPIQTREYDSKQEYEHDPNVHYDQSEQRYDPNELYGQNQQYEHENNQQYEQDFNEKFALDPNEQYERDPNQQYEHRADEGYGHEPMYQYEQDPNEKYETEPNEQYQHAPEGQYPDDSTQQYEHHPNPQHEYDSNEGREHDPAQQYEHDPSAQYQVDLNQQYVDDPSQHYQYDPNQQYQDDTYQQYDQDPNQQYENNQSYDYDANQQYEQDPNQLTEHGQEQVLNQDQLYDPSQQYYGDTNTGDYHDEQQYRTDESQAYYQNPDDQNYDADLGNDFNQRRQEYRAEDEVEQNMEIPKIEQQQVISEEATVQPELGQSSSTERQIIDPDEGKKKKDVIKAILDSDTESTIERNISNNTESEFDFN